MVALFRRTPKTLKPQLVGAIGGLLSRGLLAAYDSNGGLANQPVLFGGVIHRDPT